MTRTFEQFHRLRLWPAELRMVVAVALAALVAGSLVVSASAPEGAAPSIGGGAPATGWVSPQLTALAKRHPADPVEVIAQFRSRVSLTRAAGDVRRAGARVAGELTIINGLAVKATAATATRLAAGPDVRAITLNSAVRAQSLPVVSQLATTYNQTLGVPNLWSGLFAPATGKGVGVAVIDTGIDGNLPDFRADDGSSRVLATAVDNPRATTVMDTYGHGTHVAGIIAGNGANRDASDPLRGRYAGVAPGANLISIKVADEKGNSTVLDVIYGLQFAVDHRSDYNIRVVNLSLDSTTPASYKVDPLDAAVESAWFHGIVVVAAAGNRGTTSGAVDYAPANDPFVITVGATDEHGQTNPADDTIAPWSSRGVTQDGFRKPDVYAPGAHIVSVLAPGSYFAGACAACLVSRQYIRASGTSMAAPMVSGVVADLLELYPFWTPNQVKGALGGMLGRVTSSLGLVTARQLASLPFQFPANLGVAPSPLLGGASGAVDYQRSSWSRSSWSRSSWSRSSWSTATGALSATFARSSWSCECSAPTGDDVDTSRSSWSQTAWQSMPDSSALGG
jgi:serine protease AprX